MLELNFTAQPPEIFLSHSSPTEFLMENAKENKIFSKSYFVGQDFGLI